MVKQAQIKLYCKKTVININFFDEKVNFPSANITTTPLHPLHLHENRFLNRDPGENSSNSFTPCQEAKCSQGFLALASKKTTATAGYQTGRQVGEQAPGNAGELTMVVRMRKNWWAQQP